MDTLSSSVSTLKFPSPNRQLHHSKTPCSYPIIPLQSAPNSHSNPNSKLSSIAQISSVNSPQHVSQSPPFKPSHPFTHKNPATGYAAALVDTLQSHNCPLDSAVKDARLLSKVIQEEGILSLLSNPILGGKEKSRVIKKVGKIGDFNGFVVKLMRMLVEKNKAGILNQVLVEFQRICDELSGTKVVLVSSSEKLEENQVLGIAKTVQKLTGALQVRVRVLVNDDLPSFAV